MRLEATLLLQDLSALIDQLLPLKISFGQDARAYLSLSDRQSVELVPEVGLRVGCCAKLSWPVLGIDVPVVLKSLSVLLRPTVARRADAFVLVFQLEIERMDLAVLPALADRHVTEKVNRELDARQVELAWDFTNTLSHSFHLPPLLATVDSFALRVVDGAVHIDEQQLRLTIGFSAGITRRDPAQG
jgi:hypothetical protein